MFSNNFISQQYQSNLTIKIDGQEISKNLKEDILQVIVEESIYQPSMCVIAFQNELASGSQRDKQWRHQDTMKIGKELSVSFNSVTTEVFGGETDRKEVFKGRIVAVQVPFSKKAQAPIILRAYDNSYPLHLGSRTRTFLNKTDSEIVKDIVSEAGLAIGEIQETDRGDRADSQNDEIYVCQANMTDMEFLLLLARRNGFEFFVQKDKVYFRAPDGQDALDMTWLSGRSGGGSDRAKNIIDDITVSQTAGGQVPQIEVRAWDYKNKQVISSLSDKQKNVVTNLPNNINPDGDRIAGKLGGNSSEKILSVVDFPVSSTKEAESLAQAFCDEIRGQYIQGDAECEGNPEIWPGRTIQLNDSNLSNNGNSSDNMGGYKGKYYVTQTRHIFQPGRERVYTTEFSIRSSRSANLLSHLSSNNRLQPSQTFLIGIVTDNEDPEQMGRVKVKFPTLTEEHNSAWARIVSVGGGKERGIDWLPEIDDEVLVGFEHGSIDRPLVLGGLWNGKDAPPEPTNKSVNNNLVRLRTIKTRTGHQIQFIEEDESQSKNQGKNRLSGTNTSQIKDRLPGKKINQAQDRLPDVSKILDGLPDAPDAIDRLSALGGLNNQIPGLGDIKGQIPGFNELMGNIPGVNELSDRIPGLGDIKGQIPGINELSDRIPGLGELTSKFPGAKGLTNQIPGTSGLSDRVPGASNIASQVPGISGLMGSSKSQAGIKITTVAGHQVYLNDSNQQITIKSKGGHQIVLDDRGGININSNEDVEIIAKQNIDLLSNNKIRLTSPEIELNGNITMNSKGALKMLSKGGIDMQTPQNIALKGSNIFLN